MTGPLVTGPALLTASGLGVSTRGRSLLAGVDLVLRPGERVGLIGESGSGKSLTALALLGLLPPGLRASGSLRLAGEPAELVGAGEGVWSRLRGRRASMVFQEPMSALNPTMRVGDQVAEVLTVHGLQPGRRAARRVAAELLAEVGLPADVVATYPHQLSGGQRQRVVLAIALAGEPELLVLDEPTTALDVTVAARVLEVVRHSLDRRGAACLFISHDLAVVAGVCDRVLVLHQGRVVEAGPIERVLTAPRHPYTRGLLAASDLTRTDPGGRLLTMDRFLPPDSTLGERTTWHGTPDDGWAEPPATTAGRDS